jgi:flavorubredoxin
MPAKALAAGLECGGADVNVVKVDAVKSDELGEVDLLCVGSPAHAWNAKPMQKFLERLKSVESLSSKRAFAFGTKMKSRFAGDAGLKIERRLIGYG